jgi:gamma-glutamyltranspeptidase/glutathione hydrolase
VNVARALRSQVPSITVAAALGLLVAAFPAGCGGAPGAPVAAPPAPAALNQRGSGLRVRGSLGRAPAPAAAASAEAPAEPAPARHRFGAATENPTATRLVMDVLARGGSAVDAAIAGLLAIGITQPVSSGIGGGGFALVWDAKAKKVTALDFREVAPIGIKPSDYSVRPPPEKKRGVMVGVPGEVAGLAELHARWGKLAFADVVRGAADLAEKGFPLSAHLARALAWNEKWVISTPRYGLFHPAGALAKAGEQVKNPALAGTLRRIGAEGKAAFYEGAIAADVIATARAGGSRMTLEELQGYKVLEREPLATTWERHRVVTMPPPSAGGVMLLQALHMHTKADLTALGYGTGAYLHVVAETLRGSVADRFHHIGDPAFVKMDVAKLVDPARMKARRARIKLDATTPAEQFPVTEAGTSHLVVVDAEGNVASVTSTVNNMFGARLVAEGGFVLNDELADFTSEKASRQFGVQRSPNAPRGGARPVSSMTPTIVLRGEQPALALGGSGGTRIATGVTQVALAHLAFDRPVAQAVADPRLETPPSGGFLIDAAIPPEVVQDLQKRGEVVDTTRPNFSAVQAISLDHAGGGRVIRAAADPRKGGAGEVQ